jgi:hypothetical protein
MEAARLDQGTEQSMWNEWSPELAELSREVPGFEELCATNPALAWLAMVAYREPLWFRGVPLELGLQMLCALVRGPRRRLAAAVGCLDRQSSVRILSKIPMETVCDGSVYQAALLLGDERSQRRLAHVPRINSGVLRLLHDPRHEPHLHQRLLEQVGADTRFDPWPGASDLHPVLKDLYRVSVELNKAMPTLRSTDELHSVHRHRLAEACIASAAHLPFPPPPVPGNAVIRPLRSPQALVDEAAAQSHCLGDAQHIDDCFEGAAYYYQVLGLDRATLELHIVDGEWSIAQLWGAHNQAVGYTTGKVVSDWLWNASPDRSNGAVTGEDGMDFETVVDGPSLRITLAQLHRLAGRRPLPGLWRCDPGGVTVEWAGVRHRLPARGRGTALILVAGSAMRGLARAPLADHSVALRVQGGELQLGRRRIACHAITADIADLAGAGDTEFLRLPGVYEGEVSENDAPEPPAARPARQLEPLGTADLPLFMVRTDPSRVLRSAACFESEPAADNAGALDVTRSGHRQQKSSKRVAST